MVAVAYFQPDPDYRREVGENQSHLKHILKSPAHYQASKKRRFRVTENMEIGSALHCLVLEGANEFEKRFIVKPSSIKFTTKEGREWKEAHKRFTILSDNAWECVHGMAQSLQSMPWFDGKMADYRKFNEVSVYWDADEISCKGRLDRVVDEGKYVNVLDLKTTDSVDYDTFVKKVSGGLNYIFQAAWYAEAASLVYDKPAKFTFIGIEREAPYTVGIFEVSDEMMAEGLSQIRKARTILKNCLKQGEWEKPRITYNVMELPKWYRFTDRDVPPDEPF